MTLIMGILNVTPDSFSDGGKYDHIDRAVNRACQMLANGADIIDIGGESSRPGAKPVSSAEEMRRVIPVIEALKGSGKSKAAQISIDTYKPEIAQAAINAGADIWNDISALTYSDKSLPLAAALGCHVVLMHMQGRPQTMQGAPVYKNVVKEIKDFLRRRINAAIKAGIDKDKIIIDPGIGFGKRLDDNLELLQNLDEFHSLACPLLLGVSRKSFIDMLSPAPVNERLGGSIAAALWGQALGVDIIRVHDVKQTAQGLKIWQAIRDKENA